VGVRAQIDGRIVAEGGSCGRHGHPLLSHKTGCRVPEHARRGARWESPRGVLMPAVGSAKLSSPMSSEPDSRGDSAGMGISELGSEAGASA
jgi:hypothetical protein